MGDVRQTDTGEVEYTGSTSPAGPTRPDGPVAKIEIVPTPPGGFIARTYRAPQSPADQPDETACASFADLTTFLSTALDPSAAPMPAAPVASAVPPQP